MKDNPSFRNLHILLTPSWLSGSLSVMLAAGTIIYLVVLNQVQTSRLWQSAFGFSHGNLSISNAYHTAASNLSNYQILGEIYVFITWACVGLVVFFLISDVLKALFGAINLGRELNYVHAKPAKLVSESLIRLLIRIIALVIVILTVRIGLHKLLPYLLAIGNTYKGTAQLSGYLHLAYAAFLVVLICHVITVCLRLVVLKVRIWGGIETLEAKPGRL